MAVSYKNLKNELLIKIKRSKPGDRLSSVRELRREYRVSQATIDRAFYELENEKYIVKQQGRGTFVAERGKEENIKNFKSIALLMPQISASSFFEELAHGVETCLFENNYQMVFCRSNDTDRPELEHIRRLEAQKPDGVVYASSWGQLDNLWAIQELSEKIPLTVVDVSVEELNTDYVTTDDLNGAYEAVTYLIEEKGHSKIAMMLCYENESTGRNRIEGYRKALEDHGIAFDEKLLIHTVFNSVRQPYEAMIKALSDNDLEFTALFTIANKMAKGALKATKEYGLSVPDEFSIIGFGHGDDDNLSMVLQSPYDMGRKAVELLLEKINGKRPMNSYKEVILPTKLCIKNT